MTTATIIDLGIDSEEIPIAVDLGDDAKKGLNAWIRDLSSRESYSEFQISSGLES